VRVPSADTYLVLTLKKRKEIMSMGVQIKKLLVAVMGFGCVVFAATSAATQELVTSVPGLDAPSSSPRFLREKKGGESWQI
jgi:hypothetical protein